ncbi:hypothetical protein MESS2_110050 [Mesorhizobium metallidurans STM 2683]|uniref:Uncharacterized protein n=1 Tax=Mesorhizobium metallidurans STM 2683 TaxID=1297569 RepID=M5EH83_9HYPH|nr:hypothetical protein MESS2_110050 [Mesorhizobium metallidurans STM 2683]
MALCALFRQPASGWPGEKPLFGRTAIRQLHVGDDVLAIRHVIGDHDIHPRLQRIEVGFGVQLVGFAVVKRQRQRVLVDLLDQAFRLAGEGGGGNQQCRGNGANQDTHHRPLIIAPAGWRRGFNRPVKGSRNQPNVSKLNPPDHSLTTVENANRRQL